MASIADLSNAIALAAAKEVTKALKAILSKVAEDYDLDFSDLEAKYLSKESTKAKAKPKAAAKAKVTKVTKADSDEEVEAEEKAKCIAVTKKGERCKCNPRNGFTTCGRHKDFDPDAEVPAKPEPKKRGRKPKAKAESDAEEEEMPKPKKRAARKPATKHDHALEEAGSDCEECATQGKPFHLSEGQPEEEFEIVMDDEMAARIKELSAESEEEEEEMPKPKTRAQVLKELMADSETEGPEEGEYQPSEALADSDFDNE